MLNSSDFSMFGGAFFNFGGQQQRSNERPRGPDVTIDLEASLEMLYNGHSFEVLRSMHFILYAWIYVKSRSEYRRCA